MIFIMYHFFLEDWSTEEEVKYFYGTLVDALYTRTQPTTNYKQDLQLNNGEPP